MKKSMDNPYRKVSFTLLEKNKRRRQELTKVLTYFFTNTETTLSCALDLDILRNSITFYVALLERNGLLQAVEVRPDRRTGHKAKHYSSNPSKWIKPRYVELSLFDRKDGDHD
ncbi:MAG: hypothetical protein LUC91_08940 [Prevotella sp.]|nr:hypothetical protein [Prevotella sp.]